MSIPHPQDNRCAIWGTPAETGHPSAFVWQCNSLRAAGGYSIDLIAFNRLQADDDFKARLTTWIIDQRRAGEPWPVIDPEMLDRVRLQPALRLSERINRFFLYLSSIRFRPGDQLPLHVQNNEYLPRIWAWTESRTNSDLQGLLDLIQAMGLTSKDPDGNTTLRVAGFQRLEETETSSADSSQAFVAMWFGEELKDAYESGFATGIRDAGFTPFRIDKKEHSNKIDDEIVAEIRRSRFIVADFTCPFATDDDGKRVPNSRGGVYFEAGLAQGFRLPVIWTVRQDCLDHVHFDTRQFAHIVWSDPSDLRKRLKDRIEAVVVSLIT